jgi:gamma-glutamyltranspeptidase/glutathione hydrolase
MAFGTMGGDGQPQTMAAIFARHALFGQNLQAAITAPRWALGRGGSGPADDLKVENRFEPAVLDALRHRGHALTLVDPFDEIMGHAGALVVHGDGTLEGACDPRSDGTGPPG